MVEFVGDELGPLLQRDEIEYVIILVQDAFDLDRGPVVVAMQPFALVAFVADEVAGAKDEIVLADTNLISFRHTTLPQKSEPH